MLNAQSVKVSHPKKTYNEKDDTDARRAFMRRQARVARSLNKTGLVQTFGPGHVPDAVQSGLANMGIKAAPILKQVKNYMKSEDIRAAVLLTILKSLPESGEIILIGHSLGSVIAIDLLDHLPPDLHVRRFITIGSPAGSPALHKGSDRILKRFPYARVDDWSNFLDSYDLVTAGRGLTGLFPGAQDFGIRNESPLWKHPAVLYLKNPAVAQLIADTLYPSTEMVLSGQGMVLHLSDTEATSLLALKYGQLVADAISDKEAQQRYRDALDILQDNLGQEALARSEGRQLPPELAALVAGRIPAMPQRWDLPDAIARAVVLTFTNVIDPYEIEAGEARYEAIPQLLAELGYPKNVGLKVAAAIREVSDAVKAKSGLTNRTKIFAAAAGIALLAAGPIGIAMGGAAGAVGAAGIVSGLAAFGPGGMVGGLAMLGGLSSTGAMVMTVAATSRGDGKPILVDPTSVVIHVAIAYALSRVGEPFDVNLWFRLADAEAQINAEINRVEPFSDAKAPTMQRLQAVAATIDSLMTFMKDKKLTPTEITAAIEP